MYHFAEASESNGYDCSGLTMMAWKAAGVTLVHFTGDQWNESTSISKADLKPGDLVFYNSGDHVVHLRRCAAGSSRPSTPARRS